MMGTNYYCAGERCRKTTRHVCVRMDERVYFYCVDCGRRLELRCAEEDVCGEAAAASGRRAAG